MRQLFDKITVNGREGVIVRVRRKKEYVYYDVIFFERQDEIYPKYPSKTLCSYGYKFPLL
jgi:hypothetical protein